LAAGSSNMSYGKFLIYNVAGAILWICILLTAGYLFGHALIQVTDFVEN
ncbi:TPA: DedA family protein, partial [Acinetobacter baumannii]